MRIVLPLIVLATSVLLATAEAAEDISGLVENCNGCHGDNGVSQWSDMPTIAGIDGFTQSEALYLYRDGDRPCAESDYRAGDTSRPATSMCEVAADLADEQIEALAAHYEALPFVAASQAFDAALAEKGAAIHNAECDRCHSDGGSNPEDEASILAGQWMDYLRQSFADYASGERPQDSKMQEKLDPLGADDVEALLHFYASQQ